MDGPSAQGFLSLTAFQAEGCGIAYGATERPGFRRFKGFGLPLAGWFKGLWIALTGNTYKVSVTDLPFCIIRHEKHYVDQPPPVAFPPLSGGTIKIRKAVLS